jgi:hypothetical protein
MNRLKNRTRMTQIRWICMDFIGHVGWNKTIRALSARWRFRLIRMKFAGNTGSRFRSNRLIPAYALSRISVQVTKYQKLLTRNAGFACSASIACTPKHPTDFFKLVPKLQLGNPVHEALASRTGWEAKASKTAFPSWSLGTSVTK